MFQNAKFLTVAAATLALTLGGLSTAFAESSTSPDTTHRHKHGERREHAGWQDVRSHTGRPITGTHSERNRERRSRHRRSQDFGGHV